MINLDSKIFECETLFLQPTWSCAKNCFGCYVKEKESKFGSEEISEQLWCQLINDAVFYGHKIRTNQVTLALDTLPQDITSDVYDKMYKIAISFKAALRSTAIVEGITPQKHLTVNCVSDLEQYTQSELFEGLDLISVSNINSLDDIARIRKCAPHTKINWNILSTSFIKKTPEQIKEILTHVNQAYLLLHKSPLGTNEHGWGAMYVALKQIQVMKSAEVNNSESDGQSCKLPSLTDKIIWDGCMQDAIKYADEKTGCASNISRFQIWPDGRVTGCAYNSHEQYGVQANSLDDIVANLRDARTHYEFDRCTIPQFGQLINIRK